MRREARDPPSARRACEHQVGDVRARDQEHNTRCAKQQQERHADPGIEHGVLRPLDPHVPVAIGVRELVLHAGGESTHLVPGLIQRDLLTEARDHAERVVAAVLRGIHQEGDEDLPRADRSDLRAPDLAKRGWHDADDLVVRTPFSVIV